MNTPISPADFAPKKCRKRSSDGRSAIIIKDDEAAREGTGSAAGVDDDALTILFAVIRECRGSATLDIG